jgi:hypothetical protein
MVLVSVLSMFLAFFVHLVMAGAGMHRALTVVVRAALLGVAIGLVMSALPYLVSVRVGRVVFTHFAILGCFVALSMQSLRRAREFLVANSSTFEVICLNVLAIAFGGPPESFAFFEVFTELGYTVLVNPLGFWLPAELGWLKMLLSLWPSVIALYAASRGSQASRGTRLFLMWWVQLICITWLFPASIDVLFRVGTDSNYLYADVLLAAVGMVRVVLTLLALIVSVRGSDFADEGQPEGTTKMALRGKLVDGMVLLPIPAWMYALGGVGTFLLVDVARHLLPADVAITSGFFTILGLSILGSKIVADEAAPGRGIAHPVAALPLLVLGLLVARELPPLPRYVPQLAATAEPSPRAAVPSSPQVPIRQPLENTLRGEPSITEIRWTFVSGGLECGIEKLDVLELRCVGARWALSSLAHPRHLEVPREVGEAFAIYRMQFLEVRAGCVEYPVVTPLTDPQSTLLVVFLADASLPDQAGWIMGPDARCRRMRVLMNSPDGEPTLQLALNDRRAARRGVAWEDIVTLKTALGEE